MMPLWTIVTSPTMCGWALSSVGAPCVAQRVWAMPIVPGSGSPRAARPRLTSLPAARRRSISPSWTRGDAGRIIAAIFEPPEPFEQARARRSTSRGFRRFRTSTNLQPRSRGDCVFDQPRRRMPPRGNRPHSRSTARPSASNSEAARAFRRMRLSRAFSRRQDRRQESSRTPRCPAAIGRSIRFFHWLAPCAQFGRISGHLCQRFVRITAVALRRHPAWTAPARAIVASRFL